MSTPEEINKALMAKLSELGFKFAQPMNPHCLTAIALGTAEEPKVSVEFYLGKPAAVEINPSRIPMEQLREYEAAVESCRKLIGSLEEG